MLEQLELGLKLARLFEATNAEELKRLIADGTSIYKILLCAPYGASVQQIASLCCLSEPDTQTILNVMAKARMITEQNGIYKLL